MRHFAHNIGDYAAATAHLSFIEDAAYHRCLRRYYQDEAALPADVDEVCRLVGARSKDERKAVANVLAEFFDLREDGYHQSRADREIEAYQEKADLARRNGTKGGRPPNRRKTHPVTSSVRTEKLTTPHEPLPTPQDPVTTTLSVSDSALAREPVSKAQLLTDDWKPTEAEVKELRAELSWINDELWDSRMRAFRDWCDANATRTFNPAATWRGFMRQTRKPHEGKQWSRPVSDGMPAAEPWEARMRGWHQSKFWGDWGPRPGEPGCRVPSHLIGGTA